MAEATQAKWPEQLRKQEEMISTSLRRDGKRWALGCREEAFLTDRRSLEYRLEPTKRKLSGLWPKHSSCYGIGAPSNAQLTNGSQLDQAHGC